jgi:peptidoglycan/LPS O-acetylase OafA/YrhL
VVTFGGGTVLSNLAVHRYGRVRGAKAASVLFASIVVISFAATSVWFSYDPMGTFFWMPARIFQFALGALVAAIHLKYPSTFRPEGELGASTIFLSGTLVIAVSAFIANGHEYHLVPAALLPALGGAVAIFAINSQAARLVLDAAPVRYVGRRAYSLYLVHWPLMVMCGVFLGSAKPLLLEFAIVVGCFVLAEILYRTIETRFRLKSNSQWNGARTAGAVALTICEAPRTSDRWPKAFLEAGKKRLARDTACEASDDVKTLRIEALQLNEKLWARSPSEPSLQKNLMTDSLALVAFRVSYRVSGSSAP